MGMMTYLLIPFKRATSLIEYKIQSSRAINNNMIPCPTLSRVQKRYSANHTDKYRSACSITLSLIKSEIIVDNAEVNVPYLYFIP